MKKEELIAMVGKEYVDSWWTWERIMCVVLIAILTAMIVGCLALNFLPNFVGPSPLLIVWGLAYFGLIFGLIFGKGRELLASYLDVKKIKKVEFAKIEVEVLGKDYKTHTLKVSPHNTRLNMNKYYETTYVKVGYRV